MKLIPAPGSAEMQDAFKSPYVHKIVNILLQVKGEPFFNLVARFIKDHSQRTEPQFSKQLQALYINQRGRPDAEGKFHIPPYIYELIMTLNDFYEQDERKISFQRGAIVELLASKLVSTHCHANECFNNYRFVDRQYASDQIDVAVHSESRKQIEAYSCKIKHTSIQSEDCTNLIALADKAEELSYAVHIGTICFDHSTLIARKIRDRLRDIPFSVPIKPYGLDNMLDLEVSPF